ncbi:hypothetical protein D3C78_1116540 [compost metagenome]
MTGRVATFTPISSQTMRASHRMVVMSSGISATSTARQLRKVIRHRRITPTYSRACIL